jgi:mRNA-degrading endonuclease RelE of RelBE toxin-antitoxin system
VAKRVKWSTEARTDLRAIDRDSALRILKSFGHLLKTNTGDVKQLEGFNPPVFRYRVGAWRVIYRKVGDGAIEVVRVRHGREAYR